MTAEIDMAAVQAAAAAALAQPADAPPDTAIPVALQCETGCGRALNVVLTWVADSETRILCDVCALLLFMKIAEAVPETAPVDEPAATADDGQAATPAATE